MKPHLLFTLGDHSKHFGNQCNLGTSPIDVGTILAVAGLMPFLDGAFDFCILAPLFGYPLSGAKARLRVASTVQ